MFCEIELDQKTFDIILGYLTECHSPADMFRYDNKKQKKEIEHHIYMNWLNSNAGVDWVDNYAKKYRHYLNTIKILWSAHMLAYGPNQEFTFTEFERMQKNFTGVRPVLEQIY